MAKRSAERRLKNHTLVSATLRPQAPTSNKRRCESIYILLKSLSLSRLARRGCLRESKRKNAQAHIRNTIKFRLWLLSNLRIEQSSNLIATIWRYHITYIYVLLLIIYIAYYFIVYLRLYEGTFVRRYRRYQSITFTKVRSKVRNYEPYSTSAYHQFDARRLTRRLIVDRGRSLTRIHINLSTRTVECTVSFVQTASLRIQFVASSVTVTPLPWYCSQFLWISTIRVLPSKPQNGCPSSVWKQVWSCVWSTPVDH